MIKTIFLGIIFLLLICHSNLMCQSEVDSTKRRKPNLNQNPDYPLFEKRLQENLNDYSSSEFGWYPMVLDSLKNIRELLAFNKFNSENFSGDLFINELLEEKYRKSLLLKTSQERYKSMPKTDLGVVSEFLGVSQTVLAIILAFISL